MPASRVGLVTGGASGLGEHIVGALLSSNFEVIVLDKIRVKQSGVTWIECDLSDSLSIKEALVRVSGKFDTLDLLVNNACSYDLRKLSDYADGNFAQSTAVNIDAPLQIVAGLVPLLNNSKRPLIVNVSSVSYLGSPFSAHYVMSKGALTSLTRAINEEFRINGKIRATSLVLSTVDVGFSRRESVVGVTPARGKDLVTSPTEISELIAFLTTSPETFFSPYIELAAWPDSVFS